MWNADCSHFPLQILSFYFLTKLCEHKQMFQYIFKGKIVFFFVITVLNMNAKVIYNLVIPCVFNLSHCVVMSVLQLFTFKLYKLFHRSCFCQMTLSCLHSYRLFLSTNTIKTIIAQKKILKSLLLELIKSSF